MKSISLRGAIPRGTTTVANGAQDFYLLVKNKFYLDVFFTNVIAERGILGLSAVSDGFERPMLVAPSPSPRAATMYPICPIVEYASILLISLTYFTLRCG